MDVCRVCRERDVRPFVVLGGCAYHRCRTCEATMIDAGHLPEEDAERRHYLSHENDPDDSGYRRFVARLVDPLSARLAEGMRGLDYGSGPGPVAAAMLRERGLGVALYDPFFCPNEAVLARTYDFVICTEVAEHFHRPAEEFDRLDSLLSAGGWLGVMTCFQTDDDAFAGWHYRRDPTHVTFYRESTFRVLARQRGWSCEIPVKDVALLRKGRSPNDGGR